LAHDKERKNVTEDKCVEKRRKVKGRIREGNVEMWGRLRYDLVAIGEPV
jgi:hypothetical protein